MFCFNLFISPQLNIYKGGTSNVLIQGKLKFSKFPGGPTFFNFSVGEGVQLFPGGCVVPIADFIRNIELFIFPGGGGGGEGPDPFVSAH